MDFVISKVVMSICALTVVSILGGLVESDIFASPATELSEILRSFHDSVHATVQSGSGSRIAWKVPGLQDGKSVEISVHTDFVRCTSERNDCVFWNNVELHLWIWDGEPLNETTMSELDENADHVIAFTGDEFVITCERVVLDNAPRDFAFIQLSP